MASVTFSVFVVETKWFVVDGAGRFFRLVGRTQTARGCHPPAIDIMLCWENMIYPSRAVHVSENIRR